MVVENWLRPYPRSDTDFSFEVIDLIESLSVPSPTALAGLLAESYWGLEYLAELSEEYWPESIRDVFFRARERTRTPVKRGDWGEAVTVDYIKNVVGYLVPVPKLTYKIGANQTLPGSDCVALNLTDGVLSDVIFVESKLRTTKDTSVAVEGASQLHKDAEIENPEILPFIARQLRIADDPLTQEFEAYLFDRSTTREKYMLMLLHESDKWNELALRNLEDGEINVKPLQVYVAKIVDLRELIDTTYAELGGGTVEDDE